MGNHHHHHEHQHEPKRNDHHDNEYERLQLGLSQCKNSLQKFTEFSQGV